MLYEEMSGLGWLFVTSDVAFIHGQPVRFMALRVWQSNGLSGVEWTFCRASERKLLTMARSFVDKLLKEAKAEKESDYAGSDEDLLAQAPHVFEIMARKVRDDKKTLGTASLAIWAAGGVWHASLNHRGIGVKWHVEADTFFGVLPALEAAVTKEEASEVNANGSTRSRSV